MSSEWAKEPEIMSHPIRILVVPDADDEGRVSVRLETLEALLAGAGYFKVKGKLHV